MRLASLTSGPARWVVVAVLLLAAVVVVAVVPLPTALELRDHVRALGAWAPLVFLLAHTIVTTTPIPRTAFSLAAGLLFGPWPALVLCLVASTVSAAAGFGISRRLGGRAVARLGLGRVRMLESRLSSRGVLSVLSVRLVPMVPFAPLNYTFGVTTVRWRHYLMGTVIGLVPGTTAVVLLGDAATGTVSPTLVLIYVVSGAIGLVGIALCARPTPKTGS